MRITAAQCPNCGDILFSRARHDFRTCTCGDTSVDGGRSYLHLSYKVLPDMFELEIPQTQAELHEDYNTRADRFGLIKNQ